MIYTVDDLAPQLRLSPKALRRYLAQGTLAGRKVGKRWLIHEDAVRHFLNVREDHEIPSRES